MAAVIEHVSQEDLRVVHVPDESRYELRLGDRVIGKAVYRRPHEGNRIAMTHVEVEPSLNGRGFGSRLVEEALQDVDRQGLTVVPLCPFVAYYVENHPEHQHLVAHQD